MGSQRITKLSKAQLQDDQAISAQQLSNCTGKVCGPQVGDLLTTDTVQIIDICK